MSYLGISLAQDAARLAGDPSMIRVDEPLMRLALNRVQRDLALRINLVEREYLFSISDTDNKYAYQPGTVRLRYVRYGTDTANPDSFIYLEERQEEWFRAATSGNYPRGEPTAYIARRNWFHLWPWPETAVEDGGIYCAWSLPDDFTDLNTQYTMFPDAVRDYVVDGMLVDGLRAMNRYTEASQHYQSWLERLPEVRGQIEDASDDDRPRFKPFSRATSEETI